MIFFNDGKTLDVHPFFYGPMCTIYNSEPNTSGFTFEGLDCSDYCLLFRKEDNYYQLTNSEVFLNMDYADVKVPTLEEVKESERLMNVFKYAVPRKKKIDELKEELASTDHIFIKMAEGLDVSEYDIEQIKADRQIIRDKINVLESEIAEIEKRNIPKEV